MFATRLDVMFLFEIGSATIVFSKFFSEDDRIAVLKAIPAAAKRVVFIDTLATSEMVKTVETLVQIGIGIFVRDHHDEPNPLNPRGEEIKAAVDRLWDLLGENAVISNRTAHPACSSLIDDSEFVGERTIIVADPDHDGLTATMKAFGVVYNALDTDAAVLVGARSAMTVEALSPLALLIIKGLSTLPTYESKCPEVSENAKRDLFVQFVNATKGDCVALSDLQKRVALYKQGAKIADELASKVTELVAGVAYVDTCGAGRYDLTALAKSMEARPNCKVTVLRKDNGPIATAHGGVQYSLAVVKAHQASVNLQDLLPAGFTSSPAAGMISNATFLLHVSEKVWNEVVMPELLARFSS